METRILTEVSGKYSALFRPRVRNILRKIEKDSEKQLLREFESESIAVLQENQSVSSARAKRRVLTITRNDGSRVLSIYG